MFKFIAGTHAAVWASIGGVAILIGCKKPQTEVGIDYAQDDLLTLQQTDTLKLQFTTVREDSLETGGGPAGGLSTAVLGNMEHPQFGMHQAGFVTQLRLIEPDFDFGETPTIDSIYLSLRYTGDAYGVLGAQYLQVYELADTLNSDTSYFSNQNFPHIDEPLVDASQQPTMLNTGQSIYFGDDTLAPQGRIYLNNDFGQRLLDAGAQVYESNQSWNEYFAGIKVIPDASMGGTGAVGIDLISGLSKMTLHFHNSTDTTVFEFNISTLCTRNNLFSHNWYPPFQALDESIIESVPGNEIAGVFSGAGLKTRLNFPGLADWEAERDADRTVHKAELFLPVAPENNDSRYPIPPYLIILTENEEGEAVSTPDQNSIGLNINGYYDALEEAYRFNISQTFQQMLNDTRDGTLISENLHVVASRGGVSLAGVLLNGPDAISNPTDTTGNNRAARIVVTWSE
jgi:hypothetical protein